ncbi:MAG: ArsR/SmtB family transcription factor [Bacteroidales bacterium]
MTIVEKLYLIICLINKIFIYLLENISKHKNMGNNQSCIRLFADKVQIDHCRAIVQENEKEFKQLSSLLALAGNEVRLKILFLLEEENELCPCDLSDILGMSIPAVSQHLRKLKDGNIIEARRERQTIFYSLKPEQLTLLRPFFNVITNKLKREKV